MIDFLIKFWNKALISWVPIKHYYDVSMWISNFLLRKTLVTKDKNLQDYCITKMADFVVDPLTEKLIVNWILHFDYDILVPETPAEDVPVGGSYTLDDLIPIYLKMTIHHKYFLLKKICASQNITDLEKEMMMQKVYGLDGSDSTRIYKIISLQRFPNKETKSLLWQKISRLTNTDTFQMYRHSTNSFMSGSYCSEGYRLIEEFLDQYYDKLRAMLEDQKFSTMKAKNFMETCCPLFVRPNDKKVQEYDIK